MPKRVTMIVVGAGDRGNRHAEYALQHPDEARVVGVAEPRDFQREHLAMAHGIDAGNVYTDWRDMAARGRFADAVLICTSDAMHVEPVLAFASKGYQIMLEKPLAPTPEGCCVASRRAVCGKSTIIVWRSTPSRCRWLPSARCRAPTAGSRPWPGPWNGPTADAASARQWSTAWTACAMTACARCC